ncbi:hypothetical protein Y032_0003g1275 [Ancylostoma ceylanicum]|uniref:Uncharacterized protein n=1 Tax=Ancylostoma ceylanicum TaxID=53326 RepID=A0A016VW69_9BILA|nr:hypothetical protein Y032_0003g1275 [Ancylostoma ceylanicum]
MSSEEVVLVLAVESKVTGVRSTHISSCELQKEATPLSVAKPNESTSKAEKLWSAPYTFEADGDSDHNVYMRHICLSLRSTVDEKLLYHDSPGVPLPADAYPATDSLQSAPGGARSPLHPTFQIMICLKS